MSFRVVCISRTTAAGGEDVGRAVAAGLAFQYVDEQIIERAAQQAHLNPAMVAKAEHRQPLLRRLLEKLPVSIGLAGNVSLTSAQAAGSEAAAVASEFHSDDLRVMIRAAIHEVAGAGQAVIVAHAASMALANTDGVLRVLVTASTETRVRRLAELERIIREEAERRIIASDGERREYFRSFYKIDEELPTHYDLVINTDVLSVAQTAALIVAAARTPV